MPIPNSSSIYNNNQALVPKFWVWLGNLNKLIKVGNTYTFLSFYPIQSHTLIYLLNWHAIFYYFYYFILSLPLSFFIP